MKLCASYSALASVIRSSKPNDWLTIGPVPLVHAPGEEDPRINAQALLAGDGEAIFGAGDRCETGRQWRLGALNRAAVVMCLSAWEAYIEGVVIEVIDSFRPEAQPSLWQSINADARGKIGRFNTPNVENVQRLIADTIGLQDVTTSWVWQNTTRAHARQRLALVLGMARQRAEAGGPIPLHFQLDVVVLQYFRKMELRSKLSKIDPWITHRLC
jgi:hypothetical protein